MALIFPPSLANDPDSTNSVERTSHPFLMFVPYKWKVKGDRALVPELTKNSVSPDKSIILPLPTNGLSESYESVWEESENLKITGASDAAFKLARNKLQEQVGDLFKYQQYSKGELINDFASLAYGGVGFREFTFEFSLIPSNEQESKLIGNILNEFKLNMLPKYNNAFIEYPSFYNIYSFFPHITTSFVKYKDLVISNMTTNYFPDNITTVFKTGQPIKIDLSLTFKELDKITRKDFEPK